MTVDTYRVAYMDCMEFNLYYWIIMFVLYTSGGSCRIVEGERHGEGVSEW